MDDCSSTQSFSNLPHHHPSFHLTLSGLQSPELGYPSTQPTLDPLEQYGSRVEQSPTLFPSANIPSGGRRVSAGGDRGLLNISGLDGDADLETHLDRDNGLGGHFADAWYAVGKKEEVWDDGESCESTADDFYSKNDCYSNTNDVFRSVNCGNDEGIRHKLKLNLNDYPHVNFEAKNKMAYHREANVSNVGLNRQTSFTRSAAGSFSDGSVEYCRSDSRVSDGCVGREEDYGSSCGSGEDQLQTAETETAWLSVSPSSLATMPLPQRSRVNVTHKLDSFSEAFLSQRKRRIPVAPCGGDSSGLVWELGIGRGENFGLVKNRHSCVFDSDSYLPPSSSSSSPAHPSLASFPSPPTSSHLMSSVLSPPPTPLPPPSLSPSKVDSPSATGSQAGDSLGALQFFNPRLQSLTSIHSWKYPLVLRSFPQASVEPNSIEGDLTSSRGAAYGSLKVAPNIHQSPEPSFLCSQPPSSTPCPTNTPPRHPSFHLPSHPSLHYEPVEKKDLYMVNQKLNNALTSRTSSQKPAFQIFTGTPFPSILHSGRGPKRGRYTPRPLLNPERKGKGLYSSLWPQHHGEKERASREEEDEGDVLPHVNVGDEFQADLPLCFMDGEDAWSPAEESPQEQLLWKPWDELGESATSKDQVEKLLSMCSSSCLPGGGSNIELALHCLHNCQGNIMATLDMLLFSQPSPSGAYHYSGSDFWTDSEKSIFTAALGTCGKEFSLIQKMVKTKTVQQCVEFFYLSKKLKDKQKKREEEESRNEATEQRKSITPTCQRVNRQFGAEEAVPVPSLASFFPCKLCGKMFYKIKSRNAHMKIHRQPQEDWSDRRLQHQLLAQRLALSHSTNLMATPGGDLLQSQAPARTFSSCSLSGTANNNSNGEGPLNSLTNGIVPANASVLDPSTVVTYNNMAAPSSHVITNADGGESNPRGPFTVSPFHQSWGSFGRGSDHAAFYCSTEGKEDVGAGTAGGEEPVTWQ
ncbi:uncharacterized protein V6R79_024574 [Siganus canaliculatus]